MREKHQKRMISSTNRNSIKEKVKRKVGKKKELEIGRQMYGITEQWEMNDYVTPTERRPRKQ